MAQTPALFVQEGKTLDHTPVAAVAAGQVVELGTVPLIAPVAIAAGALGALADEGIWDVPKTSDAFTAGDTVYWNNAGNPVTGTDGSGAADSATGNLMGVAVADAEAGDSYVRVKLHSIKRAAAEVADDPITTTGITGGDASLGITGKAGSSGAGGIVAVAGGAGDTNAAGGAVTYAGGVGNGSGAGGAASVAGGAGGATGAGGAVTITGGAGGSTSGANGTVAIAGGASASTGNVAGGAVSLTGGSGKGNAAGGASSVVGGVGGPTGAGGAIAVTGGAGGSTSGTGGAVVVAGGAGSAGNANGGAVTITGGAKNGSGANGAVGIASDKACTVTIGYASGKLILVGIPTSDPANAGEVWANSNVLTLSAG